jgi:diguanylate cyclase (GGDEF)-like protein
MRYYRFGIVLFSCLWLTLQVSAAPAMFNASQIQYLQQKKVLLYCVDPQWMPFEAVDQQGNHIGMSADYIALWRQQLPIPLMLFPTKDWLESLQAVKDRRCDLLPMAMATDSRKQSLDFTETYLTVPSVIATTSEKPYINDLAQLPVQPVGIRKGVGSIEMYRRQFPDMQLIEYDSYAEGLLHVQSGLLYGMTGNMGSISYAMQQQQMVNLKIAGRIPGDSVMSVATRNDEPQLQQIMQVLLAQVTPAQRQEITNRWFTVRIEQELDFALLAKLGAILLVVVGISLLAYRKVQRLNQQLLSANASLAQLSRHDPLTGLGNRQHFEQQLAGAIHLSQQLRQPMALVMVDLDHFKKLNDQHGHLFGDHCLKQFSLLFQLHFSHEDDVLVRYGGEEFVLIRTNIDATTLAKALEIFRGELAIQTVRLAATESHCTASIGWYCDIPALAQTPKDLLAITDKALYQAKHAGRNCVVRALG